MKMNTFGPGFLMLTALCLMLCANVAKAQPAQVDMGRSSAMAAAAHETGAANADAIATLKGQVDQFTQAKAALDRLIRETNDAKASLLTQVASLRGWEKSLPKGVKAQIQTMIDEATTAAIKAKTGEFTAALATLAETMDRKILNLTGRVKALEDDMVKVKADVTDLQERVGINLVPQFLVVGYNKTVSFLVGAKLLLPAAKSKWTVGLGANVGIDYRRQLAYGGSLEVTKRVKRYLDLGPALFVDVLDNTAKHGVTSVTATFGPQLLFHAGPVDFGFNGGIGVHSDGSPNFGWRAGFEFGYRCF